MVDWGKWEGGSAVQWQSSGDADRGQISLSVPKCSALFLLEIRLKNEKLALVIRHSEFDIMS